MTILQTDSATDLGAHEAEQVLAILCAAYPGHPWSVRCDQGIIFIRHLEFGVNGYGMNCHLKNVSHDAAVLKKEIIMMAGEFLERAGLVRGRENGDQIIHVEGVPEKYQPNRPIELTEYKGNRTAGPMDNVKHFGDARDAHRQMSEMHKAAERKDA